MRRMLKQISVLLSIILFCTSFNIVYAYDNLFSGMEKSNIIIEEMQFKDIELLGSDYWARDAIYTMSALGIVKGYEGRSFFPLISVSRVQALAFIYRAMSYEEQAKVYAKLIDEQRKNKPGTINNIEKWADGYVQLACNDGLITKNQYNQAMRFDQTDVHEFNKTEPAARQEIAFWIAKVLGLAPTDNTNYIKLKNFSDYKSVNGEIAPYFDAVINAKIINGSDGKLYPDRPVTREEMAQVLMNCKPYILKSMGITDYTGIIDSMSSEHIINIKRDSGLEDCISVKQNEGLLVMGTKKIGGIELLNEGDKINYYVDGQNQIIFMKINLTQSEPYSSPHNSSDSYITSGIVQNVNVAALTITLYDEGGMTSPYLYRKFNIADRSVLKVLKNNQPSSLSNIHPQDKVFIKVVNGYVNEISFSGTSENEIETLEYSADNIYKAIFDSYDSLNSKLIVRDVMRLESGFWGYTAYKGIAEFSVNSAAKVFCDNQAVSFDDLNEYNGTEIYIAVGAGKDSGEEAVFVRINSYGNYESQVHSSVIRDVKSSVNKLNLRKYSYDFSVGDGTAIIKNGKLVTINELSPDDIVYVAAVGTGRGYNAFAVYVDGNNASEEYDIYFAYITNVDIGSKITVKTNRLYDIDKCDWIYSSRKMTFKINSNTRILDENGVVNNRDLSVFPLDNRDDVTANIVVCNGEALVISVSDSARYVMRAKVNQAATENGIVKSFYIYNARQYSEKSEEWEELENGILKVKNNTIYLKNGRAIPASDVKPGDSITAFYNGRYTRTALIVCIN